MKTFTTLEELKGNAVFKTLEDYQVTVIEEWFLNGERVTMLSHEEAIELVENSIECETICYYNTSALIECVKTDFASLDYEELKTMFDALKESYSVKGLLAMVDSGDLAEYHVSIDGIGHALNYYDGNNVDINYLDFDYMIAGDYE